MTHILRIDEMNGNGYTERQKINHLISDMYDRRQKINHLMSNMYDRFYTWMSDAIECKDNGKNYPYICFVRRDIIPEVSEVSKATDNRFGHIIDANVLEDVARRGEHDQPWIWDTEETHFTLNDMVMSYLKRIADIGCYLLIVVKDRNKYSNLMNKMGDNAIAIKSRSLVLLGV